MTSQYHRRPDKTGTIMDYMDGGDGRTDFVLTGCHEPRRNPFYIQAQKMSQNAHTWQSPHGFHPIRLPDQILAYHNWSTYTRLVKIRKMGASVSVSAVGKRRITSLVHNLMA